MTEFVVPLSTLSAWGKVLSCAVHGSEDIHGIGIEVESRMW